MGGSYPRPYYQGPSARTMGKYLAHEVETSRIINDHFLFGNGILFDIAPPMSGESLRFWERRGKDNLSLCERNAFLWTEGSSNESINPKNKTFRNRFSVEVHSIYFKITLKKELYIAILSRKNVHNHAKRDKKRYKSIVVCVYWILRREIPDTISSGTSSNVSERPPDLTPKKDLKTSKIVILCKLNRGFGDSE